MPELRFAARPFQEQVDFFRRKVSVPTAGWTDLFREDHGHGFMVAGAFKTELLNDLRGIVEEAVNANLLLDDFKKQFGAIAQKHGWVYNGGRNWRARVIYETNIRQSYNAGRYAQLTRPEMLQARPFWQYRHNDRGISRNPRPLHLSWNGKVLPWNHPWWKTHMPMNGWGCNCGIRALSARDLAKMGKIAPDVAPNDGTYTWTSPDGVTMEIPNGIDPGFDFNIGEASRSLPAAQRFGNVVGNMPPVWRERVLTDAQQRAVDWYADLGPVIDAMLADRATPRGRTLGAGMLKPATFKFLEDRGTPPATALIAVSDAEIAHMARDSKASAGRGLSGDFLRQLPLKLATPDAVLFDNADPALVYVWRLPDGAYAKAILRTDFRRKGALERLPANWVRSAGVVKKGDLQDVRYQRIEGAL